MTQPAGTHDLIFKALEYLLEARRERAAQGKPVDDERLLDEAGMRFNLSPHDAHTLARVFHTRIVAPKTDAPNHEA